MATICERNAMISTRARALETRLRCKADHRDPRCLAVRGIRALHRTRLPRRQGSVIPVALALIGLLSGCAPAKEPAETVRELATVDVVTVQASASATFTAVGVIAYRREMALAFRIPGVIASLSAEEGDAIRAGHLIATLNSTSLQASATAATEELDRARRDYGRYQSLPPGLISAQAGEARASALSRAQAAYETAMFDLKSSRLVAPAAGFLLVRQAQAGEVVQAGQTVVRIADVASDLIVRAAVPDQNAAEIHPGDRALIRMDCRTCAAVSGTVSRVGQQVDPRTATVNVEINLPRGAAIRSGQIVNVDIARRAIVGDGRRLARVPALSILKASGTSATLMTYDPKSGRAHRASVQLAGFEGDDAIVVGLEPGTQVVASGGAFLTNGQPVNVSAARAAAASMPQP